MESDDGRSAVSAWHRSLATLIEVAWPGLGCWAIIVFVAVLDWRQGLGDYVLLAAHPVFLFLVVGPLYLFLVVGPFWTFFVTTWKVSRQAKIVSAVVNLSPAAVLGLLTL